MSNNPGSVTYDPIYEKTGDNEFEVSGGDLVEWKDFYPDSQ